MPWSRTPDGRATRLLSGLLFVCWATSPWASDDIRRESRSLRQLGIETWTVERGLAGNRVNDVVRTNDGFVWVGTSGGLSRYDGRGFTNWTAADADDMPTNAVQALAVGADERVWIGLESGGMRVMERGRIRALPQLGDLSELSLQSLAATSDGSIWVGTRSGLYRATDHGVERVRMERGDEDANIVQVEAGQDDTVWIRTRSHGLWRIGAVGAEVAEDAPGCLGNGIAIAPDGHVVTACVNGLWERSNGSWKKISDEPRTKRIAFDAQGILWSGAEAGIERFQSGQPELLPPDVGVGDYRVRALFPDPNGDVWVGTFAGGLTRLHPGAVRAIGTPEGLDIDATTGVLGARDGTLWIGASAHGLVQWDPAGRVLRRIGLAQGLPSDRVWALTEDPRRPGRLFLGTAMGAFSFDPLASVFEPILLPGIGNDPTVDFLSFDPADPSTLWIGTAANGLYRWQNGIASQMALTKRLGRLRQIWIDRDGETVIGAEAGLFRRTADQWKPWREDLASLRGVMSVLNTRDDTTWITSFSHGLTRWSDNQAIHYGVRQGLATNRIISLRADDAGRIWLSSDDGVSLFWISDFERWSRGLIDRVPMPLLGERDGLRDKECNGWGQPTSWELPDGDLVYPTATGIALITPGQLPIGTLTPSRLHVDAAWSSGRSLGVFEPIELDQSQRSLRLRYSAPSVTMPEALTFRYRLDGADTDWSIGGPWGNADYDHLAPGRYVFRIAARLPGQDWVEAASSVSVRVAPRLVESIAFRLALAFLAITLVAGVLLWRLRLARQHARAMSAERAFLHDVIDTSPEPIFVQDPVRNVVLANAAAVRIRAHLDSTTEEPGEHPLHDLHAKVLEKGVRREIAECRLDDSGAAKWYRVVAQPLVSAKGNITRVVGSAVDITSYKDAIALLHARKQELRVSRHAARVLSQQLLRAQEDERRRLGRELHDDITQRIAGLAMLARSVARGSLASGAESVRDACLEIGTELEQLARSTQEMSRELHPALLDRLGLADALRAECESLSRISNTAVKFSSAVELNDLPAESGIACYRIAQESLRNAVRHASATRIEVELSEIGGRLTLEIRDNGVGFNAHDASLRPGLGLSSMAERAQLVRATLRIRSVPGSGTTIRVDLPPPIDDCQARE